MNTDKFKSFIDGFNYGVDYKEELTQRQVEEKFPWYNTDDLDAFYQGNIDGIKNDEWRLKQIMRIIVEEK